VEPVSGSVIPHTAERRTGCSNLIVSNARATHLILLKIIQNNGLINSIGHVEWKMIGRRRQQKQRRASVSGHTDHAEM